MKHILFVVVIATIPPSTANADCDPMPAVQHVAIMRSQLSDGFSSLGRVLQVLNDGAQAANDTSSPKLASVMYSVRRSIIKTLLPLYYTANDLAANEQTSEAKEKQLSVLVDKINDIEAKDAELLLMAGKQTPNIGQVASGNLTVAYNYLSIRPTALTYCSHATPNATRDSQTESTSVQPKNTMTSFAMDSESCLDEIGRRLIIVKNQKKMCNFKGDIDRKIENLYGSSGCLGKVLKEDYEKAERQISSAMANELAQADKNSFCKEANDYFYKDSRRFYDATSLKLFRDTKQSAKTGVYSKSECIRVLEAGIYNGLLEDNICNFHGGVKERILNVYDKNGCRVLVPQVTVDKKVVEIVKDTERRRKAMGTNAFCEGNIDAYNALQSE